MAGIASLPLAFALARRHGQLEAIFAAFLVGFCFTLIHFSSEARGYPLAIFFGRRRLAIERARDRPIAVVSAASARVLSSIPRHLSFVLRRGSFALSVAASSAAEGRGRIRVRDTLRAELLVRPRSADRPARPLRDARPTRCGPLLESRALGYTLGLPVGAGFAWPGLACAAVIGAAAGRLSWREGDEDWLLVLVTLVVAPALVLGVARPAVVEVRYFVVGIALYLVLASRLAAALFRAGGWRRVLCGAGLGLFALGNAAHMLPFLRYGRGGYAEAVRFMAESSPNLSFSVGSNHDFRNELILRFYARELPAGRSLIYAGLKAAPRKGSDWVIFHAAQRPDRVQPSLTDIRGNRYRFAREFPNGGISGFWWGVYRNAAVERAPAQ